MIISRKWCKRKLEKNRERERERMEDRERQRGRVWRNNKEEDERER